MRDAREQILYIGQSKNLRSRLAYYKNANPDRMPRRLVRLVHHVETISWECCPTPASARARELELLRLHRPRFNRADTGPQFFHYLRWRDQDGGLFLQVYFADMAPPEPDWRGPIRGKMIPAGALPALQRLWTINTFQLRRCADLPFLPKRLAALHLDGPEHLRLLAAQFLSGHSEALLASLLDNSHPEGEPALRALQVSDAEILASWFRLLAEAEAPFSLSTSRPLC